MVYDVLVICCGNDDVETDTKENMDIDDSVFFAEGGKRRNMQ